MAPLHDPDQLPPARRQAAVTATRLFVPAYLLIICAVFGPTVLNMGGVDLSGPLPGIVSGVGFVLMIVVLAGWFGYMVQLGVYSSARGLSFRLGPALFEGRWESVGGGPTPTAPTASPVAQDVAQVLKSLRAIGADPLSGAIDAALAEHDALRRALSVYEPRVPPEVATRARGAAGAFHDRVVGLRGALGDAAAPIDPAALLVGFEADLGAMRSASDELRRSAAPLPGGGPPAAS